MKKKAPWKAYLFWIALSELVGLAVALLTRSGMAYYNDRIVKPVLSPPPLAFPIAWGILYALMGIGAARVDLSDRGEARRRGLRLFAAQLVFNFGWSFIFFSFRAFAVAFFWLLALLALVIWMAIAFGKVDRPAGRLQIPYVLWLLFAAYLNLSVWMLNGP